MYITALFSIKGGVGKTSTAVNLAYLSAASGVRTLLWDLDPQAASSFYLRVDASIKGGIEGVFEKNTDKRIKGTDYPNFDLLPSDWSYRNLDLYFHAQKKPKQQIRRFLQEFSGNERTYAGAYEHIFIDCPPGFTLLSENILRAADDLLVPIIPTTLSLRTLDQLLEMTALPKCNHLRILPFLSMVDGRKRLHRDTMTQLQTQRRVLRSYIPYSSDVEKMGLRREPLVAYAPRSAAGHAFKLLWSELQNRVATLKQK
ncbi:MAG: ParA family protein [Gammaproteobacteria bacterium]|nr:ParA family protein [Gammaproteobacteria bacterium]MDH3465681.1 ParA family protein [Gammaproteobacteria bacterium]